MKLLTIVLLSLALSGCYRDSSRPSDNDLIDALASKLLSDGSPPELIAITANATPDKVGCTKDKNPTCRFKVGLVAHIATFEKTDAGRWKALSVDNYSYQNDGSN